MNNNVPSSSCLHHKLPFSLSKGIREVVLVVLVDEIVKPRLASELVYPLSDLVPCRVSETGEQREELLARRRGGMLSEDDSREC